MPKTNLHETVATACPVCGELLEIVDTRVDEQIECSECGELFRVVSVEPLQFAYAYEQDEEDEYNDEDTIRSPRKEITIIS
jgi:lysine biosynthesis protein LysW